MTSRDFSGDFSIGDFGDEDFGELEAHLERSRPKGRQPNLYVASGFSIWLLRLRMAARKRRQKGQLKEKVSIEVRQDLMLAGGWLHSGSLDSTVKANAEKLLKNYFGKRNLTVGPITYGGGGMYDGPEGSFSRYYANFTLS